MTTEEMLDRLPDVQPDETELQTLFAQEQPKLYARRVGVEQDPFALPVPAHWQCTCSACGRIFGAPNKLKLKNLTTCPECKTAVEPHRWTFRRDAKRISGFVFYHLFRGQGREIWVRTWRVSQWMNMDGLEIEYEPQSIYHFDDGTTEKWKLGWKGWKPVGTIRGDNWKPHLYSYEYYPAYIGEIDWSTIRGSCLEYSQLNRAITHTFPVIDYIRLYIKYPAVEYLWKTGCTRLLQDYLLYRNSNFWKAVNLRAKDFKGLFRGADKQEMKVIPQLHADEIVWFHRLYQAGAVRADQAGVDWMRARMHFTQAVPDEDEKRLHQYICHQVERGGRSLANTLRDYADYLRQLHQLGGGEVWPHDLQQAHSRLSERERNMQNEDLQVLFRMRRHLWRWAVWRHNGLLIRPIDSVKEITLEGERQNNCVAGYAKRHAQGKTVIFVLRRADDPTRNWHTVELNPKNLTVVQCRGYRNADAEPQAEAFIQAWIQHLNDKKGEKTA